MAGGFPACIPGEMYGRKRIRMALPPIKIEVEFSMDGSLWYWHPSYGQVTVASTPEAAYEFARKYATVEAADKQRLYRRVCQFDDKLLAKLQGKRRSFSSHYTESGEQVDKAKDLASEETVRPKIRKLSSN